MRILVLPIAAAVIAGLCVYKLDRDHERPADVPSESLPTIRRAAPLFELYDQNSELVKFERYVGRHRILLVFYDGNAGADRDPLLLQLRENFAKLKSAGFVIVGVSTVLPPQNRHAAARAGGFPFPLLTDVDPQHQTSLEVHRRWGRWDKSTGQPLAGCFLVERDGTVAWSEEGPVPLPEPQRTVAEWIDD